jgi:hypothetical protein
MRTFIDPITNDLSDKDFFFGTGFMGESFSNREEFVSLVKKYATKDGKYKAEVIKFSFCLDETMTKVKNNGDEQIRKNGMVELFTAAAALRQDPYHNIHIYFRPGGWIKDDKIFHVLLEMNDELTPYFGKLTECMKSLELL